MPFAENEDSHSTLSQNKRDGICLKTWGFSKNKLLVQGGQRTSQSRNFFPEGTHTFL